MTPFKFPSAKAIYAAAVAFATSLVTATADGSGITTNEWLVAIVATLVGGGAVYSVTSTDANDGKRRA